MTHLINGKPHNASESDHMWKKENKTTFGLRRG